MLEVFYGQPVGSPARATLMTGRYAVRTGVYTIVRPGAAWGLPLAERTLASALREAGFEPAICGKWHLGECEGEQVLVHGSKSTTQRKPMVAQRSRPGHIIRNFSEKLAGRGPPSMYQPEPFAT